MDMKAGASAQESIQLLKANLDRVLVGKGKVTRRLLSGLLADGHVLVEDVPGTGKTVLARALAQSIDCSFKRVQFTPDMIPSDVVGVSVFNPESRKFTFRPGPIFTNILLADEINRTTPKTQACLLECMGEGQVTVEGRSHRLRRPFFVLATQNPIESHGCYPLPEAQLDRFLLKFRVGYPSRDQECQILDDQVESHPLDALRPVCDGAGLVQAQALVRRIRVTPELVDYIVRLTGQTREHRDVQVGVSPRGSLALRRIAQASAFLAGRDFVIPDDIKESAVPVLAHRIILRHQAQLEGRTAESVVRGIVGSEPIEGAR